MNTAIDGLLVDYLSAPSNIGAAPAFSWRMRSDRPGAAQGAFRIRVWRSRSPSDAPAWDSGVVESPRSVAIPYGGPALLPARRYRWRVEVRDETGVWLPPAEDSFTTGLFGSGAWDGSIWISAADSTVRDEREDPLLGKPEAEDGTALFTKTVVNPKAVAEAWWCVTGLGVFRAFLNGAEVGAEDFLKPGFTHFAKTKHSFCYDVTALLRSGAGEGNDFAAYVSSGWWRDKIVRFRGKRSAFRAMLVLRHADGTETRVGTDTSWRASGAAGPVLHAAIFDGEDYDARHAEGAEGMAHAEFAKSAEASSLPPFERGETRGPLLKGAVAKADWGCSAGESTPFGASAIENTEFPGEIVPMEGPPVRLRHDLAMEPVEAYVWQGVDGADEGHFGKVVKRRSLVPRPSSLVTAEGNGMAIDEGETLVLDFGQNCAAVPEFVFRAARGVTLTARPAEMLNDGDGDKARHCDGPGGSAYVAEYRGAPIRARYTFAGAPEETYRPSFTFYGGRYLSITADGPVEILRVRWIPVSSIAAEAETASLETGDATLNRFIRNVLWGQRSNYLSVPTDCPQRAERLGWTADTQVFAKAASYNAVVYPFLRKWMRDMRDSQRPDGGFPGVAPPGTIGTSEHQFGWADAGIIVPYTLWRHFGDDTIVRENWDAMARYVALVERMKFDSPQAREHQWADWLSLEKLETASGRAYVGGVKNVPPVKEDALVLWRYFGACYWLWDARMMAEMAAALPGIAAEQQAYDSKGIAAGSEQADYGKSADRALAYIRENFVDPADGMLIPLFRDMQTPALFALRLGILDEAPARATRDALLANIRDHGTCLQTGFLGTAILLDTLSGGASALGPDGRTALGLPAAPDVAYSLLLQHGYPSWLYSVDQGATTVWESWDAYTVAKGFSPGVRSFNHYAYGAIFAWMMGTMAGIREDPAAPGWRHFLLAPLPDRRMGRVAARYRSPYGEIESAWRYHADGTISYRFAVPANTTATLLLPGEDAATLLPGTHELQRTVP